MNASKYKSIIIVYNAQTKYMVSPTPVISIKGDLVTPFFLLRSPASIWRSNLVQELPRIRIFLFPRE